MGEIGVIDGQAPEAEPFTAGNSFAPTGFHGNGDGVAPRVAATQTERRDRKVVAAAKALATSQSQQSLTHTGITLEWKGLEYVVKSRGRKAFRPFWEKNDPSETKKVIMNVSGKALPGNLLAVMGPEGSGKSLLLRIWGGRIRDPVRLKGQVTYNGQPFTESVRRDIGFVESVAYLQENLTVKESLMYMAQLRLPHDVEDIDRIVRVEHVLDSLELTQCADTVVGKAGGVLNNERRRLAIGLEMIPNPSLLLLDEPTSGLDGAMALRITRMLGAYAAANRTVIATYKMPSARIFALFSDLLLLAEGNPLYRGPANEAMGYFESLGYTPGYNCTPGEYLLDLCVAEPSDASIHFGTTTNLIQSWRKREGLTASGLPIPNAHTEPVKNSRDEEMGEGGAGEVGVEAPANGRAGGGGGSEGEVQSSVEPQSSEGERGSRNSQSAAKWHHDFRILLLRNSKAYQIWDVGALLIFGTVLFCALITGCLWYQRDNTTEGIRDQAGLLFYVGLFWGLLPMISTVLTFYQDRLLLRREQEAGIYHISSYFTSRILLFFPYEVLPPMLFGAVVYWMAGLNPAFGHFVLFELILVLDCMVASSVGLAVGAVAATAKQAIWVATVLQLLSLVVVDFLVLNEPSWISWVQYLSFSTYIHKLLLRVNFSADDVYECQLFTRGPMGGFTYETGAYCRVGDHVELKGQLDTITGGGAVEATVLLCMLVGYRFLAYLLLRHETMSAARQMHIYTSLVPRSHQS